MLNDDEKKYISKMYKKNGVQKDEKGSPTACIGDISAETQVRLEGLQKKCDHRDLTLCSYCQWIKEMLDSIEA